MKTRQIKKVGLLANLKKHNALEEVKKLYEWLTKHGCSVVISEELGLVLDKKGLPLTQIPKKSQLMIVLGGDGTLLWGARSGAYGTNPVLGVNLGSLGFLVSLSVQELYPTIKDILEGNFTTQKRMMLEAEIVRHEKGTHDKKTVIWKQVALNDAVITKETLARMIQLRIRINHKPVNEYRADGLIVSSPTGSTAHSLSAGGPIVHPAMDALIITPVCPHDLSNRPLIIDGSEEIEIEILTPNQNTYLTLDGQEGISLNQGDIIKIRRAKHPIHLILNPNRDYFLVLHTKLHWGRK